jgi:hypothetical protein
MPPRSPKQWKSGSTLNRLSAGEMSTRQSAWAALTTRLRDDSTTALGLPSEPEVKTMTAGSSAFERTTGRRHRRKAASFSRQEICLRMSSR